MANLTDLPDDIFITILDNFKLSGQRSQYLRRSREVETWGPGREEDIVRRADLASLAQVCKQFYRLATPLLYANRYLHLNMRTSRPCQTELNLAVLAGWRSLQYLVCDVLEDRPNTFLSCLSNAPTAETLKGLSMKVSCERGGRAPVDLRRLSRFPHLLGLELRLGEYLQGYEILVPPPSSLPFLRELHIEGMYTFAQTVNILSLASSSSLQVLGLYDSPLALSESANLWTSFGGNGFPMAHTLNIALKHNENLRAAALAHIPTYFPSLRAFNLECRPRESDYHEFLSKDLATSLTVRPQAVRPLRSFLLAIITRLKPNLKLRSIRINFDWFSIDDDGWNDATALNIIQLSMEARRVAHSHGVELRPANLTDQMQRLRLEQRERKERSTRSWGS